jgi:hypothetical protein
MVAQRIDAHSRTHERAQDGAGGGADDDIEVTGVDAVNFFDGLKCADGPGASENAATTEDEASAYRRRLRIRHANRSPSLRHREMARAARGLEELGE